MLWLAAASAILCGFCHGQTASLDKATAAPRVWHDIQNRPLQALYAGRTDAAVLLRTADGQIHEVPMARLSPADVAYAKSLPAARVAVAAAVQTPEIAAAQIDRLVASNLAAKGLKPNPPLTDEQFVRRIYLDIVGRIPRYDETVAFFEEGRRTSAPC